MYFSNSNKYNLMSNAADDVHDDTSECTDEEPTEDVKGADDDGGGVITTRSDGRGR